MKIDKPGKTTPTSAIGEVTTFPKSKGKPDSASTNPASNHVAPATVMTPPSSVENIPIVDATKVAEIKQAISEGRFRIDSGVVADKLIETVRELVGREPKS